MKARSREFGAVRRGCLLWAAASLAALTFATSCGGASSGASVPGVPDSPSTVLTVTPQTMQFGTVGVGGSKAVDGMLTAGSKGVTVSTASWEGTGYSLSGITFPLTIAAGKSVSFQVTFTPESSGTVSGSVKFFSDATSPTVSLSGTGSASTNHDVTLNWNQSSGTVLGYYVYRGARSGGPYSKISSLLGTTSFTDSAVVSGSSYYYVVTAIGDGSVESGFSNEAKAVVP